MTASNLVVFQRIHKKLVTNGKILKRSFKWVQSGISSSFRLKITSKTREEVKKRENLMTCTNHSEKNENLQKRATGMILLFFAMDYASTEPLETAEKVAVLLV